jgi:TetR/AcrR family acrAB operon transcriptional repressor
MARRTKEEAQATRSALLDAAERVFKQRGVSRTSLAEIAQAAGVTRGALYWHFKDKADLFSAMLDRVTSPLEANWNSLLDECTDPLPAWRNHVREALHQIVHHDQTRRVLQIAMQKVEHSEEMSPVVERHIQVTRDHAECERQVFERSAQLRGCRLPAPAAQLAHGVHALISGLIYSWLLDRSFNLEATALVAIDAYLRGVGLEPASS